MLRHLGYGARYTVCLLISKEDYKRLLCLKLAAYPSPDSPQMTPYIMVLILDGNSRIRCARKDKSLLFDLFKAFD